MRLFYLFLLLLPLVSHAQPRLFQAFRPGSYVLVAEPGVRHAGQVRLRNDSQLDVKGGDGQVQKLKPAEVASLRMKGISYRTTQPFTIELPGPDIERPDGVFVELADSGQVCLLRYSYSADGYLGRGAPGLLMGSGGGGEWYYLLQRPTDAAPTVLPSRYNGGAGPAFYEALRPFLAGRPDLEELVDKKRITILHIPRMIHALNTGQPYVPRRLN